MAVTVHTRDWDERNAVAPRLDSFAQRTVNGRTYRWQLAQDAYGYFWVSQQTGENAGCASFRRKTLTAIVRYAEDAKFTVTLGKHDQNLPPTDPATGLPKGWVHTPVPTVPRQCEKCGVPVDRLLHIFGHETPQPYAHAMREYTLALKGAATIRRPGFRLVYGKAEVRQIHRQCLERAQQRRDSWMITRRLPQ